jgi:hypothetical protein
MLKETWTHSKTDNGLYTQRSKIHWTPVVTLGGSTYLIDERNGSKGPYLGAAAADDDRTISILSHLITRYRIT